ncbi:MAG: site-specific DNA-methyltransferase [Selenomonadaceae bacterium]|nr:site-specific DNA-methyltransferase [Selenomonadaceae bacterium]
MIKQGDCLELMKEIPDGSVDMILQDLPFGTTDCAFDKRIPFEPMWEQFKRVTKHNAAIVLFSQLPFGSDLIQSQRKLFRYEWIWEKSLGVGFLNAKKMPLRCHENILVFYRKLPTYNPQFTKGKPYKRGGYKAMHGNYHALEYRTPSGSENGDRFPRDVIYYLSTVGALPERLHPQQKPVGLLEYLIKTYTNEGELVLDATMGSGSTGVACRNTNRQFIGFELDEHFFEVARQRIGD